ncbi:MAG: NAD(P)/FAD-dependent oxidoreductase [Patescibacteria group bacterium]
MVVEKKYDVVVIGGGPAGMMAAGRAAESGRKVLLLERNEKLGRKLLLTGNGRCNITQAQFDHRRLIECYGKNGKFLFSALSKFGPKSIIAFLNERGLETKIEKDRKVFPTSDRAKNVLNVMIEYLRENMVEVRCGQTVVGFSGDKNGKKIISVETKTEKIMADNFILATGGKSYEMTGSKGDGYIWAKNFGHNIIEPKPSLVPLIIVENWAKNIPGLSLSDVGLRIMVEDKVKESMVGDMIFTHVGISGPLVIKLSKKIVEYLSDNKVVLSLDLWPNMNCDEAEKYLLNLFADGKNKYFDNFLRSVVSEKLVGVILQESGIKNDKRVNEITKGERKKLVEVIKGIRLTVKDSLGFDQAMVTSGGVDLVEIDGQTMRSKLVNNLLFAGEIIDLDGPTGGYNLQIAWSTGFLAGISC